jgi:shikimate kinase
MWIIGMMASGKSTVGAAAASRPGGAVLDAGNRSHMSAGAPVEGLRADAATLARRLADDGTRPLLEDDVPHDSALARILEDRETLTEDLGTDMVDTEGRRFDDIVEDIVRIWDR